MTINGLEVERSGFTVVPAAVDPVDWAPPRILIPKSLYRLLPLPQINKKVTQNGREGRGQPGQMQSPGLMRLPFWHHSTLAFEVLLALPPSSWQLLQRPRQR